MAIGRVGAGSFDSSTCVCVLSGMKASGRVSGKAVRPLSVTVAHPAKAVRRSEAEAVRVNIRTITSVHFDERRDDDRGDLAGLIIRNVESHFGQAPNEVDSLPAEADRAAFLRIFAEDRVDDLR